MKNHDNDKLSAIVADLTCDDVTKCQKARRELVKMGKTAVPTLIKALKNKKTWVRWEAAKALGEIGDPASVSALVHALHDTEFEIHWLAAEALIKIGRRALAPLLESLIAHPDSVYVQRGAHHVLSDMHISEMEDMLKPLLKALDEHSSLYIPIEAKKALEAIKQASFKYPASLKAYY